ncbi:RDD family protein [Streptomyces sp. NPDC102467]|uniref:RDD family protein n=1 Tax=Streptomyces sp. NPDC102467 TaxID=3366179 RepID=UPI0037F6DCDB
MTESDDSEGPEPAGLVSRAVAAVLDALTLALAGLVIHLGVGCAVLLVTGPPFRMPDFPGALSGAVTWAGAVLYLGGCWTALGYTPAGRLMGLRVTDRAGRLLRLPRALLRAALCVTFPLGLCWVPLSRRRASLQDLVVAGAVTYDRR